MAEAFSGLGLDARRVIDASRPTQLAEELLDYFAERSRALVDEVEPKLMDASQAKSLFETLRDELRPTCSYPDEQTKGEQES